MADAAKIFPNALSVLEMASSDRERSSLKDFACLLAMLSKIYVALKEVGSCQEQDISIYYHVLIVLNAPDKHTSHEKWELIFFIICFT